MDYEAKLEAATKDIYCDLDLDGQEDWDRVKTLLRAHFPDVGQMVDARELIEHCAALAVAYMEDCDDWTGTVSDSGHLRDAIVNGDYSGFGRLASSRAECRQAMEASQAEVSALVARAELAERKSEEMRAALSNFLALYDDFDIGMESFPKQYVERVRSWINQ
jgi:hypothetical protein